MPSFGKRFAKGLLGALMVASILGLFSLISCAALKPQKQAPSLGCEKSVLYAYAPYSFIALDSSRVGLQMLPDPAQYRLAQMSAKTLAQVLENDQVIIDQVKEVPPVGAAPHRRP